MKIKVQYIKSMVAALFVVLTTTACQKNEFGNVDLSGYVPEEKPTDGIVYNHPVALYTPEDFARVKASLADGTAPDVVKQEFQNLKTSVYTTGDYGVTAHTHKQIVRGDAKGTIEGVENYGDAMRDAAAAYQFGLLWQLTGDSQYAEKGIKILNAWAAICEAVTSNDSNCMLAAGAQGFTFALAAEELRDYEGWNESDFEVYKQWMVDVFASMNYKFLMLHNSTRCGATHYWSNWDLVNLASYFQIGILTENDEMVQFVVNYFASTGVGNGNINKLCLASHTDPFGSGETLMQNQESGRDQGHATMSAAVTANLCQAAWALYQSNPTYKNLDFFSLNDNAVLKMSEFVALTNLKDGTDNANAEGSWLCPVTNIPWTAVGPWCNGGENHEADHVHEAFSEVGRGAARPGWEIIYQHYKQQGVTGYKYAQQMADKLRPEGGAGDSRYGGNSSAFDQIGWGTLMLYR